MSSQVYAAPPTSYACRSKYESRSKNPGTPERGGPAATVTCTTSALYRFTKNAVFSSFVNALSETVCNASAARRYSRKASDERMPS